MTARPKTHRQRLPSLLKLTISRLIRRLVLIRRAGGRSLKRGLAYAELTDTIWTYRTFGLSIDEYDLDGALLTTLPIDSMTNSSASALDIVPEQFNLNGTALPIGTILYFEGSRGALDIYAYDPDTGVVLATLATQFGLDDTTGGAYNMVTNTLFVVHGESCNCPQWSNQVAEIDPDTGNILNTFFTHDVLVGFDALLGGLDVDNETGLLYIMTDDSLTNNVLVTEPDGTFVKTIDMPPINIVQRPLVDFSLDDPSDDWWVSSKNIIYRLRDDDVDNDGIANGADNCQEVANPAQTDSDNDGYGDICDTDLNNDCISNVQDLGIFRVAFFTPDPEADFNDDGIVNAVDLGVLKVFFFGRPGPSGLTSVCD